MKKFFAVFLTLVLLVGALAGCNQGTQPTTTQGASQQPETTMAPQNPSAEAFNVDVFIYNFSDTYIGTVRDSIESQLKGLNVNYTFHDAANMQDTQNSQIDTAIAKGTNLLVVNIVETGSGEVVVNKAKDAGIPIIFFNREVADDVIKAYDKAVFVGTDPDQAGYMQGELVANILLAEGAWDKADLNKDGKISYIMLRADLDNPEANGRTKYSVEEANRLLKAAGKPELVQIGSDVNASWAIDKAKEATDSFLSSNPFTGDNPIELVFANNDDMALGAIQSLNALDYNKGQDPRIIVVGVDATETAQDAILSGKMDGSVKQDAVAMATCITKLVENTTAQKGFIEGTDYKYEGETSKIRIPYSVFTK
ncbi:MAG: galactose ABC transporter substrate-binding protein [Bacillota bacterium]|nr:galactose ABC transporter substrate-binding protein [Bacillota bacterium]